MDKIIIRGAREHNLKNINLDLPRNKLIVLSGLSGSGKSSLAFDTIFAEGQRRYIESLSSYARQFLGRLEKPDVDYIEGLSPAIAIEQKTTHRNPRSTVGTVTEIYDYLRLLFARIGIPHCPVCGREIREQSVDQIIDTVVSYPVGSRIIILAPVLRGKKGEHQRILEDAKRAGFLRVRIDGQIYSLEEPISIEKNKQHTIDIVVDRIILEEGSRKRVAESLETALEIGEGRVSVLRVDLEPPMEQFFSQKSACPTCGVSLPEIQPRLFSFNSPFGACTFCSGLGVNLEFDPDLIMPDKEWVEQFMTNRPCAVCNGTRLKPEALAVTVGGKNIYQVSCLTIRECLEFFQTLTLSSVEQTIASQVVKEIVNRLQFLMNVGLDYLTLHREASTLSGGEAQRIRLATQIGSSLVGVLYILDEPTIGLHQRDNQRLIDTLLRLRDLGNTLIVVEHDEQTLLASDWIVDLGPGAGIHGGSIVAQGKPSTILTHPDSLTGKYLSGRIQIPCRPHKREGNGHFLTLLGARKHNLKHIDVRFPLGKFIVITGVSGSGKSSLLTDLLYPVILEGMGKRPPREKDFDSIEGLEHIDKVVLIDQSPIGRTPRSNPATYTGLFSLIREIFAFLPESRARGYTPGRFSFNVPGGRCEHCKGDGTIRIEMHFLPDVFVTCEVCKGKRFNRETLDIRYKGKNIHEVLEMTVEEGREFFSSHPRLVEKLETILSVGLGYIKIGQSALTFSGGEAQRIKLSLELSRRSTGRTLYLLDEPTTGLHFADVKMLLEVLNRLVDRGNTVILIEHHLDVIKQADWIIDLGPEGGNEGGWIVGEGTPEEVAAHSTSHTAIYLRSVFQERE